jgi:predicted membrane channel-forming protein YqfA (hemolysin III family)
MTLLHWEWIIGVVALVLTAVVARYSWRRLRIFSLLVIAWFALALTMSLMGFFESRDGFREGDLLRFSLFGTLMTLPTVLMIIAYTRSARFRHFADHIPLPALTAVEVYRLGGLVFLWMGAEGLMPPQIGLITGLSDVFIGVTALPLAWALARRLPGIRNIAIVWHSFGIADFVIAVSLVSLAFLDLIALLPDPVMIGFHPLALIALFQLPLSIGIHLLALRQLLQKKGQIEWQPSSSSVLPKASA